MILIRLSHNHRNQLFREVDGLSVDGHSKNSLLSSVEFFCSKGIRLSDKKSLERQLHKITGIVVPVLQRTPLSEFSIEEQMS
jgi:hypothetical protein